MRIKPYSRVQSRIQEKEAGSENPRKKGKIKLKLHQPRILPKELRDNLFAQKPVVRKKDLELGLFELLNKGMIPKDTDIEPAFQQGVSMFETKRMRLNECSSKQQMKHQSLLTSDINYKFKIVQPSILNSSQSHQLQSQGNNPIEFSALSRNKDLFITAGVEEIAKQNDELARENIAERIQKNQTEIQMMKASASGLFEEIEKIKEIQKETSEQFLKGRSQICIKTLAQLIQ